ncbi:MAG: L,D-transpeptidase family protein [Acidimicrobiales bacterium]
MLVRSPRHLIPSLLVTAALALAGCGGGSGGDTATATVTSAAPVAPTASIAILPPGSDTAPGVGAPGTTTAPGTGSASPGPAPGAGPGPAASHPVLADVPTSVTVVATATVPKLTARSEPSDGAKAVASLANPIPSGTPLVVQVVPGSAGSADGEWIEALLPVEPNGTTGWVRKSEVQLSSTPYRIYVDRASYSLQVYDQGQLWIDTTIAVGTGDTPTPVGDFYLLELLKPPNPKGDYGPYAFGLSGFSEVLDGFAGADTAVIGIHGTNDPSALGTDVSHGCIRVDNSVITELATAVPLGTPVRIT